MVAVSMNSMLLLRSRSVIAGTTRLCRNTHTAVVQSTIKRSYNSSEQQQQQSQMQSQLSQSHVQLQPGITFAALQQQNHMWMMQDDDESRCALAYCLAFSNDESDFQRNFTPLDSIMKAQLQYNQNKFDSSSMLNRHFVTDSRNVSSSSQQQQQQQQQPPKQPIDTEPLPRTLRDALRPSKTRSLVITEKDSPFRIVNVNTCWEQLCGYSYVESKGKTLGSLLRGPQTDPLTATTMIAKLLQGENDVGATLINYKKNGEPFYNRIRAGPIYNEETGDISHFVGLLQEIGTVTNIEQSYDTNHATKQRVYA